VPLPYHAELSRGTAPEVIRVTAPGRQGRLFWVTLDEGCYLAVDLKAGKGVVEATPEETAVALGEVAPSAPPSAIAAAAASHGARPGAHAGLVFAGFAPPTGPAAPTPA